MEKKKSWSLHTLFFSPTQSTHGSQRFNQPTLLVPEDCGLCHSVSGLVWQSLYRGRNWSWGRRRGVECVQAFQGVLLPPAHTLTEKTCAWRSWVVPWFPCFGCSERRYYPTHFFFFFFSAQCLAINKNLIKYSFLFSRLLQDSSHLLSVYPNLFLFYA